MKLIIENEEGITADQLQIIGRMIEQGYKEGYYAPVDHWEIEDGR